MEDMESHSLQHISSCELYPKLLTVMDEEGLTVPFTPLCGEYVEFLGRTSIGVLALSNYRIYHQITELSFQNIPLGLIGKVEVNEIFVLHILCKDATICRLPFLTTEVCMEWSRRLMKAISPPKNVDDMFAFALYAWAHEEGSKELLTQLKSPKAVEIPDGEEAHKKVDFFKSEVTRLQFDVSDDGPWRVSTANNDYRLCGSYPRRLLVPSSITDPVLDTASKFRASRRIPAVVWRHRGNGAVIARCSQPDVGWLGWWRSSEDEQLINAILLACSPDSQKKLLIMDARSYATAVANRTRGGGCECPEYYPNCEIQFMNLSNIHYIRKSFSSLRTICWPTDEQTNWFTLLDNTKWLFYLSGLISAATTVAKAVENDARPVLVHCSDGWDRTPQIVSLAQLLLDPYYRTIDGFQVLVEREWLEFGHKFADRCAQDDCNERCPVFLQWLDCVHNIIKQFPCAFQLNSNYLIKLAQHTYSNMFGTFLCNNSRERTELTVASRTFSVWSILQFPQYINHLYSPQEQVLWPSSNIRDLELWRELYLGVSTALDNLPAPHEDIFPANNRDSNANVEREYANGEDLNGNGEEQNNHLDEADLRTMEESKPEEDNENQDQIDEILSTECNKTVDSEMLLSDSSNRVSQSEVGSSVESSTETLLPTSDTSESQTPVELQSDAVVAGTVLGQIDLPSNNSTNNQPTSATLLDPLDGLKPLRDTVHQRLTQLVEEYKAREAAMEQELRAYRMALVQQVCCHHCSSNGVEERPDDDGSVCSTEVSWEAVEEQEVLPTLWVPDHAVSHCMKCHSKFWLGRRKHHCRSCGKVFCADCSPNTVPLPEEQLYEPVRVCAECYSAPCKEPELNMTTCKQAAGNTLLPSTSPHTHA